MKLYTQRLETLEKNLEADPINTLALAFDIRQKSRFRATLASGEVIGVDLPRTEVLRSGAMIATETGETLTIVAAKQSVMQVTANPSSLDVHFDLMRAAYHLGNRHVPLMLTATALYFEPDHVLQEMLIGLGVMVATVEHTFEPETGAYKQHHGHSH